MMIPFCTLLMATDASARRENFLKRGLLVGDVPIACKTKEWCLGLEFNLLEPFRMCKGARGPQSWPPVCCCCVTLLKRHT